jgi:hypothetical protein
MADKTNFDSRPVAELPQSRAFYDVGLVTMHTHLESAKDDVFLAFCSCPFGGCGHMHPCQNAFNLMVGGKRLFANSGYYIAFGDEHYSGWYSATRGHNAILIDGKGQQNDTSSYGEVVRFAETPRCSYCLGDASHAYHDTGLVKARRHVALLRQSTIVIYDELEADHPAQWTWLLHSSAKMAASGEGVCLAAEVDTGRGQAEVFSSQPLRATIDTRFDPPADNWRQKKDHGETADYPDQWHASVNSPQRTAKIRFLGLLQVRLSQDGSALERAVVEGPGRVKLGGWQIEASLSPNEPASLRVTDAGGQQVLAVDGEGRAQ